MHKLDAVRQKPARAIMRLKRESDPDELRLSASMPLPRIIKVLGEFANRDRRDCRVLLRFIAAQNFTTIFTTYRTDAFN